MTESETVLLDHGTGGQLSRDLIEGLIVPALGDSYLGRMEDSAVLPLPPGRIAMTTDSFVIDPLFFGGGDIGKLAVCGTVNDLAVSGARPLYLTLALIIEAGFPQADLRRIMESAGAAAREAGVHVVAGDTKVVDVGAADKLFINTAGVGVFEDGAVPLSQRRIEVGDAVIVTAPLGNHTVHLLSLREGLGYESRVQSDCAVLNGMIAELVAGQSSDVHCVRDLTRGGLGTALNEIADGLGRSIQLDGDRIPVQHETRMAADMLGVDPIYLANEGSCVVFCAAAAAEGVLKTLRSHEYGTHAERVGTIGDGVAGEVSCTVDGGQRIIEPLVGAQLPRLC